MILLFVALLILARAVELWSLMTTVPQGLVPTLMEHIWTSWSRSSRQHENDSQVYKISVRGNSEKQWPSGNRTGDPHNRYHETHRESRYSIAMTCSHKTGHNINHTKSVKRAHGKIICRFSHLLRSTLMDIKKPFSEHSLHLKPGTHNEHQKHINCAISKPRSLVVGTLDVNQVHIESLNQRQPFYCCIRTLQPKYNKHVLGGQVLFKLFNSWSPSPKHPWQQSLTPKLSMPICYMNPCYMDSCKYPLEVPATIQLRERGQGLDKAYFGFKTAVMCNFFHTLHKRH